MPTRREFVSQSAITAGAFAMGATQVISSVGRTQGAAKTPLNILLLGGTGFIGPHFAHAAVSRGHKVSVFSRGERKAALPSNVERLVGDRDSDLRSIENRSWDSVIDLATYGPTWVRTLAASLQQRVRHYTFISTIDVYKNSSDNQNGTDEQSETEEYDVGLDPYSHTGEEISKVAIKKYCGDKDVLEPWPCLWKSTQYGPLKVLCEREAEKQFPGRTLIVRPGYMVGAGDHQARFTYWVARMEKGGEILAPGDPLQPVQFIDVRDVAEWVIRMAERADIGIYNALGPGNSMSMCEMLGGIRSIFGTSMKLTWVTIPWILNQDVVDPESADWNIWRFSRDDACKSDKAIAKGLVYRPLSVTANDTLEWYKSQPLASQMGVPTGYKVDDVATLSAHERVTSWTEIRQREKQILARWRVHQSRI